MPRPDYHAFRITEQNQPLLDWLCRFLHLAPSARGAYTEALNFALRVAVDTLQPLDMTAPDEEQEEQA